MTDYSPFRFFPKFFLFLNVYANLFLVGALLALGGLWAAFPLLPDGPVRIVAAVLAGALAAGGLFEYGLITTRLPAKWKFYRVSFKRLRKNGFHREYFLDEMYEPCMRLLIRDLLRVSGMGHEWPGLLAAWKDNGSRTFEDMMKKRILTQLENERQDP